MEEFISFEGIDGCGKSIQIAIIANYLREHYYSVKVTGPVGGNSLGQELRNILLSGKHDICRIAEHHLFLADRAQLVHDTIKPALEKYDVVLCDRYVDSTVVYQTLSRGYIYGETDKSEQLKACLGVMPALTIWLDIPVEVAASRVTSRGENSDKYDSAEISYRKELKRGFEELAIMYPDRIVRIDGTGSKEEVTKRILDIFKENHIVYS